MYIKHFLGKPGFLDFFFLSFCKSKDNPFNSLVFLHFFNEQFLNGFKEKEFLSIMEAPAQFVLFLE